MDKINPSLKNKVFGMKVAKAIKIIFNVLKQTWVYLNLFTKSGMIEKGQY